MQNKSVKLISNEKSINPNIKNIDHNSNRVYKFVQNSKYGKYKYLFSLIAYSFTFFDIKFIII